jgi:hypothetical protein
MQKSIYALILVALFALNGCATPYQPTGSKRMGGYSERTLPTGEYVVSFLGNGFTPTETIVDYALLRSAELTLAKSKKYFAVVNRLPSGDASFMAFTPTGLPYLISNGTNVYLIIRLQDNDVSPDPKDKIYDAQTLAAEIRLRHINEKNQSFTPSSSCFFPC